MKTHEICGYQFGIDADGNHIEISNVHHPVKGGWTLYVREYDTRGSDDSWDEVYDEDFETLESYENAKAELLVKYPDATVDEY